MESAAVPLIDALPWWPGPPQAPRTFLIGDSIHSDGTFLLHTLASQILSTSTSTAAKARATTTTTAASTITTTTGRIFWLSAGPWTETLVATALKRFGCEAASSYLRNRQQRQQQQQSSQGDGQTVDTKDEDKSNTGNLHILSVANLLSQHLIHHSDPGHTTKEEYENGVKVDDDDIADACLKQVYRRLQTWSRIAQQQQQQLPKHDINNNNSNNSNSWIILDDVSSMATLMGQRVAYRFILAVRALANRHSLGLAMRCSLDDRMAFNSQHSLTTGGRPGSHDEHFSSRDDDYYYDSFGAGANHSQQQQQLQLQQQAIPWEQCLVELADGILQVVPLPSGFSRHAHGRLICSTRPEGRGWGSSTNTIPRNVVVGSDSSGNNAVIVLNYLLTDTTVMAIRIRA